MGKQDDGQIGVVAALVRSAFLVNAVYAASAREHGLTQQQGQLLCVLMARSYGMGELGVVLGLAKSSLTGLVDRTERNGLVQREPDPQDTRAVRVALTKLALCLCGVRRSNLSSIRRTHHCGRARCHAHSPVSETRTRRPLLQI